MDASIAALLGAGIGAVGTALTSSVTGLLSRSQAKLQIQGQQQQTQMQLQAAVAAERREPRRQVYSEAIRAGRALEAELAKQQSNLMSEETLTVEQLVAAVEDIDFSEISAALQAVEIEGPPALFVAGTAMYSRATATVRDLRLLQHERIKCFPDGDSADARATVERFQNLAKWGVENFRTCLTVFVMMASDIIWQHGTTPSDAGEARWERLLNHMRSESSNTEA
ncbi:hypothetical protein [Streptomyces sp. NPDC095817]|uniref:hypothetical protein n=1 Tax=Streptomyces sp. NPDC095817 TaxID=3155082 RepID=UPI0033202068